MVLFSQVEVAVTYGLRMTPWSCPSLCVVNFANGDVSVSVKLHLVWFLWKGMKGRISEGNWGCPNVHLPLIYVPGIESGTIISSLMLSDCLTLTVKA